VLFYLFVHCSSKNVTDLACYNFDKHEQSLIVFGTNFTEKIKQSNDTLFSHLTRLVLLHNPANHEQQIMHL